MSSRQNPPLGSLAVQAPSLTPQIVRVSTSTCHELSLFKDLLKEYRRLDDTITMRFNRANAQVRDEDRSGKHAKGTVQDQACLYLWRELLANWKRRTELIDYCTSVVDHSILEKQDVLAKEGQTSEEEIMTPAVRRKMQSDVYSQGVHRNQVHNELTVEKIVRHRSWDAFRSRCKYFEIPPETDPHTRKLWESAKAPS